MTLLEIRKEYEKGAKEAYLFPLDDCTLLVIIRPGLSDIYDLIQYQKYYPESNWVAVRIVEGAMLKECLSELSNNICEGQPNYYQG